MVYFYVGLGGMLGSLLRYLLSLLAVHYWGNHFPIGTLLINLTGAFLLGWVTNQFVIPKKLPSNLTAALTTGVIGSYTTFSTFCFETVHLFEANEYFYGFSYIMVSLLGGLIFVKAGMRISAGRQDNGEETNG